MANLPLESMTVGGAFWFFDLTVKDPFFLLPLATSATMYLQMYFAADGINMQQVGPLGKMFMKVMPFILFPLTMNFPAVCVRSAALFTAFKVGFFLTCRLLFSIG